MSTLDYAVEHGVPQRAIDRLLVPLTAGLFFVPIERYSALAFFGLFGPVLPGLWRTRVGAFLGGMTKVMTVRWRRRSPSGAGRCARLPMYTASS